MSFNQLIKSKKVLLFILTIGLVLRLLYVFIIHPPEKYLYSDMQGYYERAIMYSQGRAENIYDSFYPPATHIIYSIFFKTNIPFVLIKLFNVILSIVTCFLIYLISKTLYNQKVGYISLAIASINFLFIDFAGYMMSETCFAFLLALMFYCFLKSITSTGQYSRWVYSFMAGLFIIIAGATKSSILLFLPMFGLWWLFKFKKYKILFNLPFYIAGFIPIFILLVLRFHSITGEYGVVSTNGGFNFFQGRSHIKDAHFNDIQRNTVYMFSSPVAIYNNYTYNDTFPTGPYDSKYFFNKGIEVAKSDVPLTIKYSLDNIYELLILPDIWPSSSIDKPFPGLIKISSILFIFLVLLPSFFILIVYFNTFLQGLRFLIILPILSILITTFIFYGDPRFRVPYDVFFIVLAGYFYYEVFIKIKNWLQKNASNKLLKLN